MRIKVVNQLGLNAAAYVNVSCMTNDSIIIVPVSIMILTIKYMTLKFKSQTRGFIKLRATE